MKIDRYDQAKILSSSEIVELFTIGLKSERDRALFGICLYCGLRISEACTLRTRGAYRKTGGVRQRITVRKENTKGKASTRSIPVCDELREILETYSSPKEFLFPGRWGRGYIHPESADKILRAAFDELDIEGASTHSFRRTCLTKLHLAGVPTKVIKKISGHKTLAALDNYLEVADKDLQDAVSKLKFH